MAKGDFARTGILAHVPKGLQFTRFQVVGERSSGTNFAKRLLGRNSPLKPTEALGWKHALPMAGGIPDDLVVIGCVRRADDWARSMHTKPWHCTPAMQRLEFADFLKAPWDTVIDRPRYFDGAEKLGLVGKPLQHDRHPLTGERYANLFQLRQAKLAGVMSYFNRNCAFVLLRMETLVADPETMLDQLLEVLGQPARTAPFRPIHRRLGSKFKPAVDSRPKTPSELSAADMDFLKSQINPAQEAALGYEYS